MTGRDRERAWLSVRARVLRLCEALAATYAAPGGFPGLNSRNIARAFSRAAARCNAAGDTETQDLCLRLMAAWSLASPRIPGTRPH